jgi:hypothetical protein
LPLEPDVGLRATVGAFHQENERMTAAERRSLAAIGSFTQQR